MKHTSIVYKKAGIRVCSSANFTANWIYLDTKSTHSSLEGHITPHSGLNGIYRAMVPWICCRCWFRGLFYVSVDWKSIHAENWWHIDQSQANSKWPATPCGHINVRSNSQRNHRTYSLGLSGRLAAMSWADIRLSCLWSSVELYALVRLNGGLVGRLSSVIMESRPLCGHLSYVTVIALT